jgi:hypothetical protein
MIGLLCFVLAVLAAPIKSKMRLEAENAVLRHQLTVLRRRLQGRVRLTNKDRRLLIVLYRWFPSILQVLTIIRPETLIHWHRSGFCCYWRWKSRSLGGRPPIEAGILFNEHIAEDGPVGHRLEEGRQHLSARPMPGVDQGPQSRQHRRAAGAERELE